MSLFLAFLHFLFILLGNIEGKGMAVLYLSVLFNILFNFYVLYDRIKDLPARRTLSIKLGVPCVIAVVSGLIQGYAGGIT
jgi:O-antigen/teichoic acid export membrane protein